MPEETLRPRATDAESLIETFCAHAPNAYIGLFARRDDGTIGGRFAKLTDAEAISEDLEEAIAHAPGYSGPGKFVCQLRIKGFRGHCGQVDVLVDYPRQSQKTVPLAQAPAPTAPVVVEAKDEIETLDKALEVQERLAKIFGKSRAAPADTTLIEKVARLEAEQAARERYGDGSEMKPVWDALAGTLKTFGESFAAATVAARTAPKPPQQPKAASEPTAAPLDLEKLLDTFEVVVDLTPKKAAKIFLASFSTSIQEELPPVWEQTVQLAATREPLVEFLRRPDAEDWLREFFEALGIETEEEAEGQAEAVAPDEVVPSSSTSS